MGEEFAEKCPVMSESDQGKVGGGGGKGCALRLEWGRKSAAIRRPHFQQLWHLYTFQPSFDLKANHCTFPRFPGGNVGEDAAAASAAAAAAAAAAADGKVSMRDFDLLKVLGTGGELP